jgi:DNA-binding SARP family transcriptional activator
MSTRDQPHTGFMVRVLGPVDLVVQGDLVPVGGRHERLVLATLAVSANHWVTSDQLAQILWGDQPPSSRANTLQTYVSRLKHRLGGERICGEDHSYELHVAPDELDALVFEQKASEAEESLDQPNRCLELCRGALALWRGPPFGELGDEGPFQLEAIRLTELRLRVMEMQLESRLMTGQPDLAIGALEALVHEYPYRERMWYLLMYGLAITGRRVEALRSCASLRQLLAEVGLQPSSDIRELEEEILTEDPRVRSKLRDALDSHAGGR